MKFAVLLGLVPALSFGEMTRVFIGTGNAGIFAAKLDEKTGNLSELNQVFSGSGNGFLSIMPGGQHLFATARQRGKDGGVISFKIDGLTLKETSRQSYPGQGLCHVSLDATNRVLFGADYGGGSVVSFPVEEGATLAPYASFVKHEGSSIHPKRQKQPHAHSIYPGPGNRFAYAPDLGTDKVEIYQFDSKTAKLTSAGAAKVPPGSGARHMKFSKNGKQAYVLNELTLTITVFDRNEATGQLVGTQTLSVLPEGADGTEMSCSEILVSRDGKFVYTANRDKAGKERDSLSVLKVADDGKLTRIQTVSAEVWIPRNINLTPSGKFLLAAGQRSNEVEVFKVDLKTGHLSAVGQRVEVKGAMCIAFP